MRKATWLGVLLLALVAAAVAEEFLLKDGTKVVGRMVAIKGDKIEVETRYGKMQVRRADVQSINFPENQSPAPASEPKAPAPVEEALDGTHYVNRTGKFTLTVPIEWKINPDLRSSSDALAGLSSRNEIHFVAVVQETVSATLDGYKGVIELQLRTNLLNFAKVAESARTIDGQPAVLLSYTGTSAAANNLPIHFLTAIIAYDGEFVRISAWCVEPLFSESQRTFEAIITSYRKLPNQSARATSLKPLARM